jgi:hypothetical protein
MLRVLMYLFDVLLAAAPVVRDFSATVPAHRIPRNVNMLVVPAFDTPRDGMSSQPFSNRGARGCCGSLTASRYEASKHAAVSFEEAHARSHATYCPMLGSLSVLPLPLPLPAVDVAPDAERPSTAAAPELPPSPRLLRLPPRPTAGRWAGAAPRAPRTRLPPTVVAAGDAAPPPAPAPAARPNGGGAGADTSELPSTAWALGFVAPRFMLRFGDPAGGVPLPSLVREGSGLAPTPTLPGPHCTHEGVHTHPGTQTIKRAPGAALGAQTQLEFMHHCTTEPPQLRAHAAHSHMGQRGAEQPRRGPSAVAPPLCGAAPR